MNKSAKQYIADNDFEGAKERFDNANVRWYKYWFEVCQTIALNNKEWFTKYLFNATEMTIVSVVKTTTTAAEKVSFVYLIKLFDINNEYVFLKGGKTTNPKKRFKELSKYHYKRQDIHITNVEVIKMWELPTEHLAESFEQLLHAYFSNFLQHFRNDRFVPIEITETDFEELEKRYQTICNFV